MKRNAPELDEIQNIELKEVINKIQDILLHMYNNCLQAGNFPTTKGNKPPDE